MRQTLRRRSIADFSVRYGPPDFPVSAVASAGPCQIRWGLSGVIPTIWAIVGSRGLARWALVPDELE